MTRWPLELYEFHMVFLASQHVNRVVSTLESMMGTPWKVEMTVIHGGYTLHGRFYKRGKDESGKGLRMGRLISLATAWTVRMAKIELVSMFQTCVLMMLDLRGSRCMGRGDGQAQQEARVQVLLVLYNVRMQERFIIMSRSGVRFLASVSEESSMQDAVVQQNATAITCP